MLAFVSKFVLNIFPSVAASVIGAYIVHNYIYVKPAEPPRAVAASAVASKAVDVVVGHEPSIMPIPVNAKVAEVEAPAVARERAESDAIASTSDKTATGRDKHSAVHMRSAHALARAASERPAVANRAGRSAETQTSQRERVQANSPATPAARSGPILMPAVDLVPDEQVGEAAVQPRIAATRADPVRILPSTSEMPLMKRLASFSNDVETKLVSQTVSTADDIVTAAKSAFHTMMPR
jgi:hypothetical protein